jgi:small subunit ribosomal protein S20
MPQTKSAEKALRSNVRRRALNDSWRRAVRVSIRAVRDAVAKKDKTSALAVFPKAQQALDRAARRHVIHANAAARTKSRLQKAITTLQK